MGSAPSIDYGALTAEQLALQQEQQGYNLQDFQLAQAGNLMNQSTPYGTLQYNQTGSYGGIPTYTASTNLSPPENYLLQSGLGSQEQAATQGNQLLSGVNYAAPNNIGSMTSGLTGQMLGAETQALNPEFNQQTEAMQSQLANQGLTPTDPAYQVAMNNLLQSQYQGIDSYLASAQPSAFQEAQSLYQEPLGIAADLYGLGQGASLPSNLISTPQQVMGVPSTASAYQAASGPVEAQAQLQEQQYSSMLGAIGGIAGALLSACDERLKKNIQYTGQTSRSGIPKAKWNSIYDDSPGEGYLADDVKKVHPDLVHEIKGIKFLDTNELHNREGA